MIAYGTVIFLSILLYGFLYYGMHYKKAHADKITITFFFISYLILLCLRDVSVGVDLREYLLRFNYIKHLNWGDLFISSSWIGDEPAFLLLNRLIGEFGGERLFIMVVSCMIVLPVLYFYRNEGKGSIYCLSFFLISLLFSFFFSGIRQSIAIGLAVPAYYMVKKKNLLLFFIIVIIAFLFHKSALIIAVIYPIYHANITRKWLWFLIPIMFVVLLNREFIFGYITLLVEGTSYVNYSQLSGQSEQGALSILFILLALYSYFILDEEKAGEEEIGLRNILLLAAFIHIFTVFNPVFGRMNYYNILFIPVAITRVNNCCKRNYYQIANVASFVMSTYFIIHFLISSGSVLQFDDYKFFF